MKHIEHEDFTEITCKASDLDCYKAELLRKFQNYPDWEFTSFGPDDGWIDIIELYAYDAIFEKGESEETIQIGLATIYVEAERA